VTGYRKVLSPAGTRKFLFVIVPPARGLGERLRTPHCKKPACYEMSHRCVSDYYKLWSENLKGRDHSEELAIDGNIILD
jgi:hypothetical protein